MFKWLAKKLSKHLDERYLVVRPEEGGPAIYEFLSGDKSCKASTINKLVNKLSYISDDLGAMQIEWKEERQAKVREIVKTLTKAEADSMGVEAGHAWRQVHASTKLEDD